MKLKLLFIGLLIFLVSMSKAEDAYYLPIKGKELKPLKSCEEVEVKVTDYLNFQYQVKYRNHDFSGGIWAAFPLYGKKGKTVQKIKDGFNVKFSSTKWLISFLNHQGFTLIQQRRNIYTFKNTYQNEIALK